MSSFCRRRRLKRWFRIPNVFSLCCLKELKWRIRTRMSSLCLSVQEPLNQNASADIVFFSGDTISFLTLVCFKMQLETPRCGVSLWSAQKHRSIYYISWSLVSLLFKSPASYTMCGFFLLLKITWLSHNEFVSRSLVCSKSTSNKTMCGFFLLLKNIVTIYLWAWIVGYALFSLLLKSSLLQLMRSSLSLFGLLKKIWRSPMWGFSSVLLKSTQ